MGYELYCGDKEGTVKILSTVTMSVIARDLTPKQVEDFMYDRIKEKTGRSAASYGTPYGKPILGLFHDETIMDESHNVIEPAKKPVLNKTSDILKYADKYAKKWKKWAQEKVDECKFSGKKHGEAIHTIEFPTGRNKFKW